MKGVTTGQVVLSVVHSLCRDAKVVSENLRGRRNPSINPGTQWTGS